jgi:hypothetical protein
MSDEKENQENWNRRELDRDAKQNIQGIQKDITLIKQYIVKGEQREESLAKIVAKHDNILYGNGKEGIVISVAKLVDTAHALADDMWNKSNGIGFKLDSIMAKKKDYDEAVKAINNLTIKVGIVSGFIGGVFGLIAGFLERIFHK